MFDFFQTLSTCHTVQVAGIEIVANGSGVNADSSDTATTATSQTSSPSNDDDDPERLQKVTTFNNISEENENTTTTIESDLDEVDFISKLERLIPSDDIIDMEPAPEYANVNFAAKYDRFNSSAGKNS